MKSSASRIAIVIASCGRPEELGRWIGYVQRQTARPAALFFAVTRPSDLPPREEIRDHATVLFSQPGLPIQRNIALSSAIATSDIIAFFDDDYVPSSYCVEAIDNFFRSHPDVVGINGTLLADGINSAGISYQEAAELVARHDALPQPKAGVLLELEGLYGCNMVFRTSAIGATRFDEELPLYAWQEDIDFASQVGRRGRLVTTNAFYGVHQGVKGARLPGVRLGYSQVVNPIYLARKGTLRPLTALKLIIKNLLMNHRKAVFPEPWIDRAGRCKGNWLALFDVLRGRDHPTNIRRFGSEVLTPGNLRKISRRGDRKF
jgi:GT2 family glycosyltransferase